MKAIIKTLIISSLLCGSLFANDNRAIGYVGLEKKNMGYIHGSTNYLDINLAPEIFIYANLNVGYKYSYGANGFTIGIQSGEYEIIDNVFIDISARIGSNEYKAIYQCGVEYEISTYTTLQANYSYNRLQNSKNIGEFSLGLVYKF